MILIIPIIPNDSNYTTIRASGFTAALPSRRSDGDGRRGETRPRPPEHNEATVSLEKACRSKVKQGNPGETENADMVRPRGR